MIGETCLWTVSLSKVLLIVGFNLSLRLQDYVGPSGMYDAVL